jgi:glutamate racemase
MLALGIDTVVLGCTHYPFVIPLIEKIAGPGVRVIDPAPAVARQVERVLEARGMLNRSELPGKRSCYFTTGDADRLEILLPQLIGEHHPVSSLTWVGDQLALTSKAI